LNIRSSNRGSSDPVTPVNTSLPYNRLAFTTAEDAVERDPASYEIYGSAAPLPTAAGSNVSIAGLTLIASGSLSLPAARNAAPTVVAFTNTTAYAAYLLVFPTVKNAAAANSTQIADVGILFLDDATPTGGMGDPLARLPGGRQRRADRDLRGMDRSQRATELRGGRG